MVIDGADAATDALVSGAVLTTRAGVCQVQRNARWLRSSSLKYPVCIWPRLSFRLQRVDD